MTPACRKLICNWVSLCYAKTIPVAGEFEQAIKLDPHLAVAHYRLGQTLNRMGQKKQSAQELETFRKLDSAGKQEETVMAFLLTREAKQQ